MFTCIAQRSIVFPSHHTPDHPHPLPQMYNLALNQQLCTLRRWSQIRAVERSRDIAGLPEALSRNGRNCHRRCGIEDRGHGTTVKSSGRIA